MVTYPAVLHVPRPVVEFLARLLATHRRRIGTRHGIRALGPFRQAMFVLRCFRESGCVHCLARDAGMSQATGYRCLHEGIDLLAARAPDVHEVLAHGCREGVSHVILDGTLISCDRVAGVRENGNDLWYSGKARRFAGNLQFLSAPGGTPIWVSQVGPGSTPDIGAARLHALPALYRAARDGLPTLVDLGYQRARIGIHAPTPVHPDRAHPASPDNRTHDRLLRGLRALGERAAAPQQSWRTLQHITISPNRIGSIAKAALVLNQAWIQNH